MKNKRDILGLMTNIVLVSFLFCFIVAGLNIIGIYSLPAPIEKLLGTYDNDANQKPDNDSFALDYASFDESASSFQEVELGYENAYAVLNSLSPRENYVQKVKVVHTYNTAKRIENFDIIRNNALYTITITDAVGAERKRISQLDDKIVSVSELNYDDSQPISIKNGNFDISEECGFVLSAKEFIESGYNLTDADFSMITNDNGVYVSVEFDTSYNNLNQRHRYVISLDYGVVTEVQTFENGVLLYEMTSSVLSDIR